MISRELVGTVIRRQREAAGISQEVLSGLAGLDRTHYSKIERGQRMPMLTTLFQIADALDMSPHALIKAVEDAEKRQDKADV